NRGKKVTVRYRIFRDASKDTSYSNVLEFVVGQAVALDPPTIDSVKGSPSGKEIVEGGTTVETSVVLSGTAAKGKNVEIRDGATVKDQVTADPVSGIWTYTASGLTVTKHSFTATGKYGAEPASAAYTLTVTTVMVPTLSNVLDDKGMEVPDRQTTVSTSLTLKGSASKGQDVEVYDGSGSGAVSKGMAKADEITGLWERTITVAVGARRLYAKSLYHSSSVYSNVRYLSVIEDIAPTIDSANGSPSGADILPGGTTSETAVTLSGNAANGQNVEIFDGAVSKGPTTADPTTGDWTQLVSALAVAEHSFTAKALYGNGQTSAARTLTVAPAFIIDTSTSVISGRNLSIADSGPRWLRTGKDPAGTTADRTPSSGVPPYRYRSGDSGIASVEETTGRVRSEWNGTTRIYVTDSLGRDASYEVIVRNVIRLIKYQGGGYTSAQALAWRQSLGGALIGPADLPLLVKYARVGSPDYDNGRGIGIAPLLNRPTVAPHARPGHYLDYLVGGTVEPWTWWILDGITNPTPDNYISTTLLVCLVP
ncbi:hypothetical protein, partial [Pseudomonas monsensis]